MRLSLKRKVALFIVATISLVNVLALSFFDASLKQAEVDEYTRQSIDLAHTVAAVIDSKRVEALREAVSSIYNGLDTRVSSEDWGSPKFEAYLANFASLEQDENFLVLQDQLRVIQDINHVDCLYLVYIDADTKSVVYLVDAAYEDVCHPGTFDPLVGGDLAVLDNPSRGFDPSITNTEEYGWNIATAKPIYNRDGTLVAYACVDISMTDIVNQRHTTIMYLAIILFALMALVIAGGILLAGHTIVNPINALAQASLAYRNSDKVVDEHLFADLGISTGDEIEYLADSMSQMEDELHSYARELTQQANNDTLTHVRNKRAYMAEAGLIDAAIAQGDTAVGIAMVDLNNLKEVNDAYGHDKGDITLKTVCTLICQVFDHSPVFRVGGDEFVVVLRDHDLEHVDELVLEASHMMEVTQGDPSLKPWEKIEAAIGYAIFDPTCDADIEAVYNRADQAMYERKSQMKGNARA